METIPFKHGGFIAVDDIKQQKRMREHCPRLTVNYFSSLKNRRLPGY